ncbi:hypothetical protein NECAME_15781 [Necator americanus]|uniref:Uncharacterized protein n=1 Tax=Necator americanus TaxID=51031 RepID=W2SG59_NECAM|nr:hypothetical protein NECAME_15781 [Necator americanus]ETN68528.1 hypothetical protein NECAME_15781 [Necator americanus]
MARQNGLLALIGDGVHKLNPFTLLNGIDKGQFYRIHASCCSGTEVPILHPFTRHKNVAMYRTIFGRLKEVIGHVRGLRVVLESGKAAIRAAKEAFPKAHVEG